MERLQKPSVFTMYIWTRGRVIASSSTVRWGGDIQTNKLLYTAEKDSGLDNLNRNSQGADRRSYGGYFLHSASIPAPEWKLCHHSGPSPGELWPFPIGLRLPGPWPGWALIRQRTCTQDFTHPHLPSPIFHPLCFLDQHLCGCILLWPSGKAL